MTTLATTVLSRENAQSKEAEQEKKQKWPKQNLFGPNGALYWLRAAETDCGNVDRGHHFAKQQASEDEHDRGYAAQWPAGSDGRVPPAKACGTKIWRVSTSVAVRKRNQDENVANRQDHGKYKGEDAVLSSAATTTFVEWIRAK